MRDKNRIRDFCNQLAYIWASQCSDLRFGQLVSAVFRQIQMKGKDPFYLEEGDMIDCFKECFSMGDKENVEEEK